MIHVAIINPYPVFTDGLKALIQDADEIKLSASFSSADELFHYQSDTPIHVALITVFSTSVSQIEDLKKLSQFFPKMKLLVLSMVKDENFILKTIKAGVKGHLSSDADRSEIIEAIYTLRNGHEYYAKTITDILLHSYLSDQKIGTHEKENKMKVLSARELEVLTLFAEGMSNRQIAEKLFISVRTVETHKNNIMKKIELKTTVDLVKFAIKNNIIQVD
jgi:DNA-binding NarL/FixJ family response regulator